jgi:hypothetical protein
MYPEEGGEFGRRSTEALESNEPSKAEDTKQENE